MTQPAQNVIAFPGAAQELQRREVRRYPLRDGDPGIARTIGYMRALATGKEGATHPLVRQTALDIVRGIHAKDKASQIATILQWVKDHIDFRGEYKETLQSPVVTLQMAAGDCDDHSTLLAALLKTLGFNTRFTTVASDAEDPKQFTHVYTEVEFPRGQWSAVDSTIPESYPGWSPTNVYRAKAWQPLGDGLLQSGDGGSGFDSTISTLTPLIAPLDQALAYKIMGTTPVVGDLSFGNLFSTNAGTTASGIPWTYVFVGMFVIWAMTRKW